MSRQLGAAVRRDRAAKAERRATSARLSEALFAVLALYTVQETATPDELHTVTDRYLHGPNEWRSLWAILKGDEWVTEADAGRWRLTPAGRFRARGWDLTPAGGNPPAPKPTPTGEAFTGFDEVPEP